MERLRLWSVVAVLLLLCASSRVSAYSVLAHEALIDAAWSDQLEPILRQRFPNATPEAVRHARAYAYGGSLIQDLGYYPFGSRFFSNLVHYVRSGDFVAALLRESQSIDDYAFALGALAHYSSDVVGHPVAVNRALPLMYPKLREKFGPEVLYANARSRHVMVEFSFDVLQVARGTFKADAYQDLIGFEVAKPVLERAFHVTYGLDLKDVFGDVDLAIGTYRKAASEIVPDVTRVAWRDKRKEILAATPDVTERNFVYTMTRRQYDDAFGTNYRKPGILAKVVVAIFKVLPKFGPFKTLAFEPLTPEAEKLFLDSFAGSREHYQRVLRTVRAGRLALDDTDLDTGKRPVAGANPLADDTYRQLLSKLADKKFAGVSPPLRAAINEHFATRTSTPNVGARPSTYDKKTTRNLAALNLIPPR